MKRLLASIVTLCLIGSAAASADCTGKNAFDTMLGGETAAFEEGIAEFPYGNGRYWEITKNGKRSVLIGTFHVPDPRVATLSDALINEITNASVLFVELNAADEKAMQASLAQDPSIIFDLTGKQLRNDLSEGDWAELVTRAQSAGIPPNALNIMQPWFVGLSLAMPPCMLKQMTSGDLVLDKVIEKSAVDAGIPVQGLDDVISLFQLLGQGTREEQITGLKSMMSMMGGSTMDELETTLQLYLGDRIADIWVLSKLKILRSMDPAEGLEFLETFERQLLTDRNTAWMEQILPSVTAGNAVIAVGALHLGGETGLLKLLEAEGFSVKQLSL